jgi:cell wall-associated NlpC family hydrolase
VSDIQPGDVLVVTGSNWAAKLIEIGAILRGRDAASHVAVYHHHDAAGVPWAIEGRPGGVGWRDARSYLNDRRTLTNAAQPKTPGQRDQVMELMVKMLGTPYDWAGGIAGDAAQALNLPKMWAPTDNGTVPGHVVCSSLAAWGYDHVGLKGPQPLDWEHVTPGAWGSWIIEQGWERPSSFQS